MIRTPEGRKILGLPAKNRRFPEDGFALGADQSVLGSAVSTSSAAELIKLL